jgi:iron-sulfur cluster assembly protein
MTTTAATATTTLSIELTDRAVQQVRGLLSAREDLAGFGLRVAVEPGGCAGYQYELALDLSADDGDVVLGSHGFNVFVDPTSAPLLDGIRIDYVESLARSGFTFDNPNASRACGCGTSFTAEEQDGNTAAGRDADAAVRAQVEVAIDRIRPHLQADGGDLEVVSVSGGVASVRFVGACAGCGSGRDATLSVIERRVLAEVSEVRRVVHVP